MDRESEMLKRLDMFKKIALLILITSGLYVFVGWASIWILIETIQIYGLDGAIESGAFAKFFSEQISTISYLLLPLAVLSLVRLHHQVEFSKNEQRLLKVYTILYFVSFSSLILVGFYLRWLRLYKKPSLK